MNKVTLQRTTSADTDFQSLIAELNDDLRKRNGDIMDIYEQHNLIAKLDTVVIAYLDGVAVGSGCFKSFDQESVELKRMFVQEVARGKGISKMVLRELEIWAQELGFRYTVLETGVRQMEAQALYQKAGYVEIPKYGPYVGLENSICFGKTLA
ncbi:GNAT family N-acetyltransferase [Pedobacter sp. L105]|uniref:GNAT family N-acetyltransferase n=1 Tax=Pedobacter sp. L105 TaxID=1641871 RepID=UPI00131CC1AD|nr:GNAT family N-acetyltransferase [Pedobacter sp. L105]